MDAFELLKQDHKKVSKLFSEIESASGKTKSDLFSQLKAELDLHAHIEETILYPALENTEDAREIALEAYEEHKVVKDLLGELASAETLSDEWDAKLTVLKENVEHHVEEEEGELFDKARKALGEERIDSLGAEMEAEKARQPKSPNAGKPTKAGVGKTAASKSKAAKAKSAKSESPGVLQRLANLVGLGEERPDSSVGKAGEPAAASRKPSSSKLKSKPVSKTGSSAKAAPKRAKRTTGRTKSAKKSTSKTRSSSKATPANRKKPAARGPRTSATKTVARASSNQKVKARGSGGTKRAGGKSSAGPRSKSR